MFPKQTQIAFLESLYAIYFNSAGEFAAKKANIQNAVTSAAAREVWNSFDSGEDINGMLNQIRKGQNIELKPFGVHIKKMLLETPDAFGPAATTAALKFAAYFRTGSEGAARTIRKLSGSTVLPNWIRGGFAEKNIDQSSVANQLKAFVKEVTGKVGLSLTKDQAEELRAEDRVKYKEYLQLRKAFSDSWKNAAVNFIRDSGKETVPMKDLIKHLDSQSLEYSIVPGFTGNVGLGPNSELEWYTPEGKRIVGVPTANFFSRVEMNKNPSPGEYIFTAIPATEGSKAKYFYLAEDLRQRREEKFKMIQDIAPNIKNIRRVWLDGVRHFDLDDDKTIAALLLELSYEFASRIGTEGNSTKGQATFGLSTTLVRHLKLQPNGFTLTYPGKDGVNTSHKYTVRDATSRMVFNAVKDLVEGKKPGDPIFTVGSSDWKPIRPAVVNHVFRKLSGHAKIGSHKMRTLRGTVLFTDLVDQFIAKNQGKTLSARQVEEAMKQMAAQVGQVLNHVRTSADGEPKVTGDTALNAYIDPSAQARLFDQMGTAYPKALVKRLGQHRLDSSALLVLAADEGPTDEELDQLEENVGDEAFSDEALPADEPTADTAEDTAEDEVLPADEPSDEPAAEEAPSEEAPEDEAPKEDKTIPAEEPVPPETTPAEQEEKTMDEARMAAEMTAEEDSALLSRILQDPGIAENN